MKNLLTILFISFFIFSCKNIKENPDELILGKWLEIKSIYGETFLEFKKDNTYLWTWTDYQEPENSSPLPEEGIWSIEDGVIKFTQNLFNETLYMNFEFLDENTLKMQKGSDKYSIHTLSRQ